MMSLYCVRSLFETALTTVCDDKDNGDMTAKAEQEIPLTMESVTSLVGENFPPFFSIQVRWEVDGKKEIDYSRVFSNND